MSGNRALHELLKILADPAKEHRTLAASRLGDLHSPEAIPALTACLSDPDMGLAEAAAEALTRFADPRVAEAVAPLLRSEDLTARNLALAVLKRLGPAAEDTLGRLTIDADPDIRIFSVEAIGAAGHSALLDRLLDRLGDENPNVAIAAAVGLGELGDDRAVEPLVSLVDHPLWIRTAAIQSLGTLGGDRAEEVLLDQVQRGVGPVQHSAVAALGRAGTERAVAALEALHKSAPPQLSLMASGALVQIFARTDDSVTAVESLGIETLTDLGCAEDLDIAGAAVRLLGRTPGRHADRALVQILTDTDEETTHRVMEAVSQREITETAGFVRLLDDSDRSYLARSVAIMALQRQRGRRAIEALTAHLRHGEKGLRVELVQALDGVRDEDTRQALRVAAEDVAEGVRCVVAAALDPEDEQDQETLLALLTDDSANVRISAVQRLREVPVSGLKPHLYKLLDSGADPVVRAVLQVLNGDLDEPTISRLVSFGRVADGIEVSSVAASLLSNPDTLSVEQRQEVEGWLLEHCSHADARARTGALRAIRALDVQCDVEKLLTMVARDASELVRYEAALALQNHGSPAVASQLLEIIDELPPYVQAAVLETLGEIGDSNAREMLERFAGKRTGPLADSARSALARLEAKSGGREC
jgi:HEAT repeat protein